MKVRDLVEHILHHVNAEADSRDSSQVKGVADRARYIQYMMRGFAADERELSRDAVLAEMSNAASLSAEQVSFKKAITNMRPDDGVRPQLAIQAWVGKAQEKVGTLGVGGG